MPELFGRLRHGAARHSQLGLALDHQDVLDIADGLDRHAAADGIDFRTVTRAVTVCPIWTGARNFRLWLT